MLIYGPTSPTLLNKSIPQHNAEFNINNIINANGINIRSRNAYIPRAISSRSFCLATAGFLAAAVVVAAAGAVDQSTDQSETLANIPQTLSGECAQPQDCKKARIQRPKSRKAESCTIKCVTTCIRGGDGSPGEGPFNVRRPLVVFKQGFRSRQYCLVECSDICNLIGDGDDGP